MATPAIEIGASHVLNVQSGKGWAGMAEQFQNRPQMETFFQQMPYKLTLNGNAEITARSSPPDTGNSIGRMVEAAKQARMTQQSGAVGAASSIPHENGRLSIIA